LFYHDLTFDDAFDAAFYKACKEFVPKYEESMTKRRKPKMLEALRNLNLDRVELDDGVALLAVGESLGKTYTDNQLETPEWVTDKVAILRQWVKDRSRDNLDREIKLAEQKRSELRTAEEKRGDLDSRIERLKAKRSGLVSEPKP